MAREPTEAPVHLRPHAEVAERVLLPGDPGRALRLAQVLIDGPKMLNHNRGLWGYSGPSSADGQPLTIQSTGLGGPGAALIVEDLIALGARRLVRVGTCVALDATLRIGDLLVADPVLARDGTSRALGADVTLAPDPVLSGALGADGARTGAIASADTYAVALDNETTRTAVARDLSTAAVLAAAARHGAAAAAILLVVADASRSRMDDIEVLHAAELVLGHSGAAAFGG